jgi:hypothetical protein
MTFDYRLLTIEGSFRTHFFFLWNPQSVNVSVAVEPQALLQACPQNLNPPLYTVSERSFLALGDLTMYFRGK